jgi:hypothetical protein
MSTLLTFTTARRTARANLLSGWLDGATFKVYTGPRPATPESAVGDAILLCTFTFEDPAGSVTDGVWSADPLPAPAVIVADGTPLWGRAADSEGVVIGDFGVGTTGSGNFLELTSEALVTGFSAICSACGITEG